MPFSDRLASLWTLGISRACQELGWRCVRADMIHTPGFVVGQLYQSITAADVIIGEMTDRNPNVFYEVGFAHALGKPTILLAETSDDLKAFDTQGLRHFLHGGDPAVVRETLARVLPEIEAQLSIEPMIPDATTLYEWPSEEHPDPGFAWTSSKPGRELQIDVAGGQRILNAPGLGPLISISNTKLLWNHRPGHSVMRLLYTKALSVGDIIHVFLDGRTTNAGQVDLVGDGGWVEDGKDRKWAEGWPEDHLTIQPTTMWTRWRFSITVAPTVAQYDLSRGIAVYLVTNVEQGAVLLRKIRLIQRRMG